MRAGGFGEASNHGAFEAQTEGPVELVVVRAKTTGLTSREIRDFQIGVQEADWVRQRLIDTAAHRQRPHLWGEV